MSSVKMSSTDSDLRDGDGGDNSLPLGTVFLLFNFYFFREFDGSLPPLN